MSAAMENTAPDTPEALLAAARNAWRKRNHAISQLARLQRYARLSPGMKDDQRRHSADLTDAEATLARVLGKDPRN